VKSRVGVGMSRVGVMMAGSSSASRAGSGRTASASASGRGAKKIDAGARGRGEAKGVVGVEGSGATQGGAGAVNGEARGGAVAAGSVAKPARKPYTMSKPRVSWTEKEHDKFLKALQLYDRDWKKIENYVETKTVIQIRSHAQKYFLKVMKDGTGEHVPPPRRKAKNNEGDKVKKKALHANSNAKSIIAAATMAAGAARETPAPEQAANVAVASVAAMVDKVKAKPTAKTSVKRKRSDMTAPKPPRRAPAKTMKRTQAINIKTPPQYLSNNLAVCDSSTPDFTVIYSFLAGLFGDNAKSSVDHAAVLQRMSPVDKETTVLLMRNVCTNFKSKQMWNQQLQLVGAGCVTFLNPEDAQYFIEAMAPKAQGKKQTHARRDDSDTTKEKNSGDGSGGGSNEAPQQESPMHRSPKATPA